MRISDKIKQQPGVLVVVLMALVVVGVSLFWTDRPLRRPNQVGENYFDVENIKEFKLETLRSLNVEKLYDETRVQISFPAALCNSVREIELVVTVEGMSVSGELIERRLRKKCFDMDPESMTMTWVISHQDLLGEGAPLTLWTVSGLNLWGDEEDSVEPIVKISTYEFVYVFGDPVYLVPEMK